MREPQALDHTRTVTVDLSVDLTRGTHAETRLEEFKTVRYGVTHYSGEAHMHNAAVERRVAILPSERRAQTAGMNSAIFDTPPGQAGPMEQRPNLFPEIVRIATGCFHFAWSQSLIDLLKTFAAMEASAWQDRLGEPSVEAVRSTLF